MATADRDHSDAHVTDALNVAAEAVRSAEALLVTAGAGMGVDSGLPDFRGPEGFWRAYPPYRQLGLRFEQLANPGAFARDPYLAWGFYGHRLALYRATPPHDGFVILRRWGESMPGGWFVFTSNVDGQFQRAGFDDANVVECHGSIHHLQCTGPCGGAIWAAGETIIAVDDEMRAADPLPRCPECGGLARPNILMFGDPLWLDQRTAEQDRGYERWLNRLAEDGRRPVVVECGAGTAIPTVRFESERVARRFGARLVRINLREHHGPTGTVGIPMSALDALRSVDERRECT